MYTPADLRYATAPMRVLACLVLTLLTLAACASPPAAKPPTTDLKLPPAQAVAADPATTIERSQEDGPLPVTQDDAVRGPRDALVTIMVFSDFQCPFCARLEPTLEQVRQTYGDEVRFVFKNQPLPFHVHATLAATIGQGVLATRGQQAFWTYHDMLFRRQRELVNPEGLRRAAASVGLDEVQLDAGLESGKWAAKVKRDMALAAKVGANGTPQAFVNGVGVSGAQPYEKFKSVIDAQLVEARALVTSGTSKLQVYRTASVSHFAKTPPPPDDKEDEDREDTKTVWKVPVNGAPVRGKATALVTMVLFSDFQCPYCKRVEPTIDELRKLYGENLRVVWRDMPLPFHPRAMPAAQLARFARAQKGDAGFWDVHDRLFASQPKLEDSDLEDVARAAGLDPKMAAEAIKPTSKLRSAVQADADFGDEVEATGTPHFFVNGRRIVGAQNIEKFKAIIDEEIVRAKAELAKGATAANLYDRLVKDGKTAPEPPKKTLALPASAPSRGPANAPVTVQMFSDFQCPFCARVNPTVEQLLKAYPTKVRVVWRDNPLPMHPDAPLAAEAAREAFVQKGSDGFWKMHGKLFANQQQLTRSDLETYAQAIGLDMTKFRRALDTHVHKATIDAEAAVAVSAGMPGTPAFLVGPYFVSGAQPFAKFKRTVDRALGLPLGQSAALDVPPPPEPVKPATAAPRPVIATAPGPLPPGFAVSEPVVGTGRAAAAGDKVTVHYVGTLADGSEFDSSRKHGKPFTFDLGAGHVIKGWEAGIPGMKVGGRRKLVIPPDFAYGARGAGTAVPPNATLTFDVELLKIE